MAETPALWAECEHGKGDDYLHYGEQTVRRVPAGALVIEDPDKAVERMLNAAGDGWANATRQIMTRLLHAAAGEGET